MNTFKFKSRILYSLFLIFLTPSISFAAFEGVNKLLTGFGGLIKSAIPIAFSLSFLFFFWGIAQYVLHAGDEKKVGEGRSIMIYGIIAIFVISSIWGLVGYIGGLIGVDTPTSSGSASPTTVSTPSPCGSFGGAGC